MKKIKSLAAVFLALFILAAIPTQAFAAETHEGVATMHTHQWRLDHYDTTYIPIDDETHLKTVYPVYYCTVSGCTNSYLGNGASSTVSHTMSSYSCGDFKKEYDTLEVTQRNKVDYILENYVCLQT